MAKTAGPHPIVRCHHCGAAVHMQEAQAITVDPDGAMRVWTPERAAYFQRYAHVLAPIWQYLCPACYEDLFASAAQADAKRDEKEDHAHDKPKTTGRPRSRA